MITTPENIAQQREHLVSLSRAWAGAIAAEDHHSAWGYVDDLATMIVGVRAVTVEAMRAAGRSWEDIGDVIGISKQAAWDRYRHRISADVTAPQDD